MCPRQAENATGQKEQEIYERAAGTGFFPSRAGLLLVGVHRAAKEPGLSPWRTGEAVVDSGVPHPLCAVAADISRGVKDRAKVGWSSEPGAHGTAQGDEGQEEVNCEYNERHC